MLPSADNHHRVLVHLTLLSHSVTLFLLFFSSYFLPLFDSSARLIPLAPFRFTRPLLRWDSFHFIHIAEHGYSYEHQWAFFPGVPFLIRHLGSLLSFLASTQPPFLLAGAICVCVIACDSTKTLYQLSLHHLQSPSLAFVTALLTLLPSSPATLHFTPYNEPFFTYLSYKGMLFCSQRHYLFASFAFTLASTFRSNGIFLSGFLLYGILAQPIVESKHTLRNALPSLSKLGFACMVSALPVMPFIYHNYSAYRTFCAGRPKLTSPPWCSNSFPIIYSYVQSEYWGSGFLKYWTPAQIPNFLIAAPPLVLFFSFSGWYIKNGLLPLLKARIDTSRLKHRPLGPNVASIPGSSPARMGKESLSLNFLTPSLIPHVIHSLVLCITLLFAAHTQITLRLAASMPLTYWAAAWLLVQDPYGRVKKARTSPSDSKWKVGVLGHGWGWWWVAWSMTWGMTSVVLWGAGLPPA